MKIVKVNIAEGEKQSIKYPMGVDLSILMDKNTVRTKYLSEIITRVRPGLLLKPCHSHKDIEEIVFVVKGKGKAWIDGEVCEVSEGDSLLFPANSKHMVKNTGKITLELLCFFSSPDYRKEGLYVTHEDIIFEGEE